MEQNVAGRRWKLLKNMLLKETHANDTCDVSVRRFKTFELVRTEPSSTNDANAWFDYSFFESDVVIKVLHCGMSRSDVLSFNNTGNVCVWPSEEVMAHYCLRNGDKLSGLNVCELGGGMTCLAGLVVASSGLARHVLLTDGNEKSVENVTKIIAKNDLSNVAECETLRWDSKYPEMESKFDLIISADCLFFDEYRTSLVETFDNLLSLTGEAWIFAPSRGQTLNRFLHLAGEVFVTQVYHDYDEKVTLLHKRFRSLGKDVYDADLHYPLFVKLSRPT